MKKVLVIGSNGKVGRILTSKLKDSSHFIPTAVIRNKEQIDYFQKMGVGYEIVSLEDSVDQLAAVMKGMDAVVFTAGSGGKTGYDMTLAIDLDGAVKAMEAAEKVGVKRFVMVSAAHADDRSQWETSGIKPYYIAKHYADRVLKSSGLDYTILRPGLLLDDTGSDKITIEHAEARKSVPREDVASFIVEVLEHDNTIGKIITFNQGDLPIKEAVRSI